MALRTSLVALAVAAIVAPAAGAPTVKIVVPRGFAVSTFATGLGHPTAMAWGPDNRLYVTEDTGLVVVARRGSRKPLVVARRMQTPLGLAWRGQTLFVSEQGRLTRFRLQGRALTGRHAVVRGLPFGLHQQDNVVLGSDGRLYLGSGSTCDACLERNPRSATVLSLRPDGSDLRIVASGLRNPFGLAFQPGRGVSMRPSTGRTSWAPARGPSPPRWWSWCGKARSTVGRAAGRATGCGSRPGAAGV